MTAEVWVGIAEPAWPEDPEAVAEAPVLVAACGDREARIAFTGWALENLRERMGWHGEVVKDLRDLTGVRHRDPPRWSEVYTFTDATLYLLCERVNGTSWWRGVTRAEWKRAALAALAPEVGGNP